MFTELIMHVMKWNDIWYADMSTFSLFKKRWMVGVWSGKDHDMLCTKHCKTTVESYAYMSPSGATIFTACIRSVWRKLLLHAVDIILDRAGTNLTDILSEAEGLLEHVPDIASASIYGPPEYLSEKERCYQAVLEALGRAIKRKHVGDAVASENVNIN